jgi:hypothetical protein
MLQNCVEYCSSVVRVGNCVQLSAVGADKLRCAKHPIWKMSAEEIKRAGIKGLKVCTFKVNASWQIAKRNII